MGTMLKEVVDIARNLDVFKGALKVASKDIVFTPGTGVLDLPPSVEAALSYWLGLQISFNYIVNVGDTLVGLTTSAPTLAMTGGPHAEAGCRR